MKIQLEPALSACLPSSTPLYAAVDDGYPETHGPLGLAKGDCWARETPDGHWAHIVRRGSEAPREGFAPISGVRCSLADKHHLTHRMTSRPLFGAGGRPVPEDVSAHAHLRDHALLAVAQSVAASAPRKLAHMFHMTPRGIRVHTFSPAGAAHECLLSHRVLHTRDDKPLGAGRSAAWPLFLEKAFAATHEEGYAGLCKPRAAASIFTWLLGVQARTVSPILPGWVEDIAELFEAGECVVLHKDEGAFAVVGVTRAAGITGLTLTNPAGGTGVFQTAARLQISDKKPGGKWRSYTRTYFQAL